MRKRKHLEVDHAKLQRILVEELQVCSVVEKSKEACTSANLLVNLRCVPA